MCGGEGNGDGSTGNSLDSLLNDPVNLQLKIFSVVIFKSQHLCSHGGCSSGGWASRWDVASGGQARDGGDTPSTRRRAGKHACLSPRGRTWCRQPATSRQRQPSVLILPRQHDGKAPPELLQTKAPLFTAKGVVAIHREGSHGPAERGPGPGTPAREGACPLGGVRRGAKEGRW